MWLEFFVPGVPVPQGSKNSYPIRNKEGTMVGVNTVESASARLRPWRTDVKIFADDEMKQQGLAVHDGPISLHCHFVMTRPKTTPKTRPTPPATKKPDLDKLIRAIGDAIKGVVYTEDSRITEIVASKRIAEIGEQTGVLIRVGEAQDAARW